MKRMSTALLLVLLAVLLLALAGSATAPGAAAQERTATAAEWPQRNLAWASKPSGDLDILLRSVNMARGQYVPDNPMYILDEILSVQAVLLPTGEWRIVCLFLVHWAE